MREPAAPPARTPAIKLQVKDVMKQTEALYKRLFFRSILIAGAVSVVVKLLDATIGFGVGGAPIALLSLALTLVGYAFVEGALIDVVGDLHEDGDSRSSFVQIFERTGARLRPLVAVSLLTGFGVALGSLFLLIPGLVLLTRWAVAVPVVMLEGASARDAMRRSRELVRGNGRAVFNVVFRVGLTNGLVGLIFSLVARGHGLLGFWLSSTVAATLTAPYAAHAVTVLYYRLTEPERPIALEPGKRWHSIWDAPSAVAASDHR
jgi:hypothetical protein